MTKYDKLFNVKVHNPSKAVDFHDVVKLLLVRILKRKHKNTEIYTEYNPDSPNSSYPDIWIKIKNRRYVYEIQKDTNKKWLNDIIKKYDLPNYDLIVVSLKDLPNEINKLVEELDKFAI